MWISDRKNFAHDASLPIRKVSQISNEIPATTPHQLQSNWLWKKMVKHLMWIMVRKTRPVDICRYYTRKTKICGHKFHKYVQHMLRKQAEQICSEMDKLMQLLLKNSQAAWILMSTAMAHQLGYNLTLQYPGDMLESANMVDNHPPRPFGGYFKRFFMTMTITCIFVKMTTAPMSWTIVVVVVC